MSCCNDIWTGQLIQMVNTSFVPQNSLFMLINGIQYFKLLQDCGPVISSVPFDCIPVRQAIEKLSTTVLSQHTPPITRQYSNECLSIVAGAFLKPVADIVNPYALAPTSSIRSALEEWKAAVMKLRNVKHVVGYTFEFNCASFSSICCSKSTPRYTLFGVPFVCTV